MAVTNTIGSYRDLKAWQSAYELGKTVYRLSASFPNDERFGLTSQFRRSAIAVASNIAEGYGRGSKHDYVRFLKIARGSLYEVDTQLLFALDFRYVDDSDYSAAKELLDETERILAGLIRSVDRS